MRYEDSRATTIYRIRFGIKDDESMAHHEILKSFQRIVLEMFVADIIEIHIFQH